MARGRPKGIAAKDRYGARPLADGRFLDANGYVRLPRDGKNGSRLEHRAVMETLLGRPLRPGETVHHRNGIRHDNDPENLRLRVSSHPKGSSVGDLLEWARKIIEDYGGLPEQVL